MTSGIYEILNTTNGKRYIGSAINFAARWKVHRHELRHGFHHSVALQRAWNKYGAAAFKFKQIITCAKSMLLLYEQQLIDKVRPEYNALRRAGSRLGMKHTPEAKAKISAALIGNKYSLGTHPSAKTRAKLSAALHARIRAPETISKIAAANRGQKRTAAVRAKMSVAKLGKKLSVTHRLHMSEAHFRRHKINKETQ